MAGRLKLLGIANANDAQKLIDKRTRVNTAGSQKQDNTKTKPQKKDSIKNNNAAGNTTSKQIPNNNPVSNPGTNANNTKDNFNPNPNNNVSPNATNQNFNNTYYSQNQPQTPISQAQKQPSLREQISLPPSNPLTQQDYYSGGTPQPSERIPPQDPKSKKK